MKRGRLLSPEEIGYQQRVIVVPCDAGISRGVGLGTHPEEGSEAVATDALVSAARRGSVHLYALPDPAADAPDHKEQQP
jgi:hypothetical protein